MTTTATTATKTIEAPVDTQIRRAADRAGIGASRKRMGRKSGPASAGAGNGEPTPKALVTLLERALAVVNVAEACFESGEDSEALDDDPAKVLREALRTITTEAVLLAECGDESFLAEKLPMLGRRLEQRSQLALLIHDFRRAYGSELAAKGVARESAATS
jgi:hypothetical protein